MMTEDSVFHSRVREVCVDVQGRLLETVRTLSRVLETGEMREITRRELLETIRATADRLEERCPFIPKRGQS